MSAIIIGCAVSGTVSVDCTGYYAEVDTSTIATYQGYTILDSSGDFHNILDPDKTYDLFLVGGGSAGGTMSNYGGGGGAGAKVSSLYGIDLSDGFTITIGARGNNGAGGTTSVSSGDQTYSAEGGGAPTNTGVGASGGTGGGGGATTGNGGDGGSNGSNGQSGYAAGGTGDGLSKYPWGDNTLPLTCAGGGGGAPSNYVNGKGGTGGGGDGASGPEAGHDATYYGSGGGGRYSSTNPGKGYKGAVFIREHVA